jgi:hypothetical protein
MITTGRLRYIVQRLTGCLRTRDVLEREREGLIRKRKTYRMNCGQIDKRRRSNFNIVVRHALKRIEEKIDMLDILEAP